MPLKQRNQIFPILVTQLKIPISRSQSTWLFTKRDRRFELGSLEDLKTGRPSVPSEGGRLRRSKSFLTQPFLNTPREAATRYQVGFMKFGAIKHSLTLIWACLQLQKLCEHEQACTRLILSKARIWWTLSNLVGRFDPLIFHYLTLFADCPCIPWLGTQYSGTVSYSCFGHFYDRQVLGLILWKPIKIVKNYV